MFKRAVLIIFSLLCFSNLMISDEMKDIYTNLLQKRDFDALYIHLTNWEKQSPDNPEMYIGFFNYYVFRNKKEGVVLGKTPKSNAVFKFNITDPKTGKVVGYMNGTEIYNSEDVQKGITYIEKALSLYPNRLDMHFGKVYILGEIEDYNNFTEQLIKIMDISKINNNKWLWADGKELPDAKNFVENNIQAKIRQLFALSSDEGDELLYTLSKKLIEVYPDCIYGYDNTGLYCMLKKDYKGSLSYFKQAEAINSKDGYVLWHMAIAYENINDLDNAKAYYIKVISYGDEQLKRNAKKKLDILENK